MSPQDSNPQSDVACSNLAYAEMLYEQYLENPASVSDEWREYFDASSNGDTERLKQNFRTTPRFNPPSIFRTTGPGAPAPEPQNAHKVARIQERLSLLIRNYRLRGHNIATLNPLDNTEKTLEVLDPAYYGITEAELDQQYSTLDLPGPDNRTLREALELLRKTYCGSIGVQFMHIDDIEVRHWLQKRFESTANQTMLNHDAQLKIFKCLTDAAEFERFIQNSFTGAKRFSLEGGETLIPLLDLAIEKAGTQQVEEIVIGMAHRGRLNVLANIVGKSPSKIFKEFKDGDPMRSLGGGDVKYHLGYSSDWTTKSGRDIHISLCFNPSHLEFVNPVAAGRVKAKQIRINDREKKKVLGIHIHGDAAFIGEGVVQETLNLSELRGFRTGGTLHVVVNNQIGFTTAPDEGRSCQYATDIAKMLQIPIFHVNGEDPEAVAHVIDVAMDFRNTFRKDVVVDMYCYRLLGHNESDEPAFTHPQMYSKIKKSKPVHERYLDHLLNLKGITREEADKIRQESRDSLAKALKESDDAKLDDGVNKDDSYWRDYFAGPESKADKVGTAVPVERLSEILEKTTIIPDWFTPHRKIERWLQTRREMAKGNVPIDWAAAETLAFGALLTEGHPIRFSGQDSRRGTFSHRHATLYDLYENKSDRVIPLNNIQDKQAKLDIRNSPLSENSVLGFEYGYSLDMPEALVIWEAQFGDFCNTAQVIIDQFIATSEDKWHRYSGLVMLLPHGWEGQGPEHSSARLERFLNLAAEDNMQIVNATTPAQYFHLLRQQGKRKWRKPLVVMAPKSLLRHPEVTSTLADCASGTFQKVLPSEEFNCSSNTKHVILCSGKVYYDLLDKARKDQRDDVALVRIEQIYPFPLKPLKEALATIPDKTPVTWVQEEPFNMGAWYYLRVHLGEKLFGKFPFECVSREASASPATGSKASHDWEQAQLLVEAFERVPQPSKSKSKS